MDFDAPSLWALFGSAFLSSTLLPGGSEVVLAVLTMQKDADPWLLLSVATVGNTLGGMTTWGVGKFLDWWYPSSQFTKPKYQRGIMWLRRWGSPVLLLSWVPVVGDPLCLAGGWLRVSWFVALLWIGLGKGTRYAFIVLVAS